MEHDLYIYCTNLVTTAWFQLKFYGDRYNYRILYTILHGLVADAQMPDHLVEVFQFIKEGACQNISTEARGQSDPTNRLCHFCHRRTRVTIIVYCVDEIVAKRRAKPS